MTALSVGDLVTNRDGSLAYHVRHVGPRYVSLEPVRRTPGRHATTARSPRFVRSAELERMFSLVSRARRAMIDRDDVVTARRDLSAARTWLERAYARDADNLPELTWALVSLEMNRQQLKRIEAAT